MALTKCPECGNEISKKATSCPHCGAPAKKKTSLRTWLALILIGLFFIGYLVNEDRSRRASEEEATAEALKTAKATAYFRANRETVIEKLRKLLRNEEYDKVIAVTTPYLPANDPDLRQIYDKALEMQLLAKAKKLPADDLTSNEKMYAQLMKLNPSESVYKNKYDYYAGRLKEHQVTQQRRIARFGSEPTMSPWDHSYLEVKAYLQRTMNDPDSLKMDGCTDVYYTENGWLVGCYFRGRNAFGGMVRQFNWFTVVHGQVVAMHNADAYRP